MNMRMGLWCIRLLTVVSFILCALFWRQALSRDSGQWAQLPLEPGETALERAQRNAWFNRQKMPDNDNISCCGEADAYYADKARTGADGNTIAIITDDRKDAPLGRRSIPIGTEYTIPRHKMKDTRSDPNLTGHTIIFVGTSDDVFCYLPDGGI